MNTDLSGLSKNYSEKRHSKCIKQRLKFINMFFISDQKSKLLPSRDTVHCVVPNTRPGPDCNFSIFRTLVFGWSQYIKHLELYPKSLCYTSSFRLSSWMCLICDQILCLVLDTVYLLQLIWTSKGRSKVSVLERCPYYRGHEYDVALKAPLTIRNVDDKWR